MWPLQTLGGVQGRQRDHVLVFLALAQGGNQGDGLCHLQQVFGFGGICANLCAGHVFDLAAAAPGHPVAKLQHIGPAGRGHFFVLFTVVQVRLVTDLLEPFEQESERIRFAQGVACAVLQVVDVAAKLVQTCHRAGIHRAGQAARKQGLEQAQFVLRGKGS